MAGWVPTPMAAWHEERALVEGRWPSTIVIMDLRFWADPIACAGRPRPSSRALARAWNWSPAKALRFINAAEKWQDPRSSGEAAVKQEWSSGEADEAPDKPIVDEERSSDEAAVKQEWSSGEAGPKETHAQSPFTLHPSPNDEDKVPSIAAQRRADEATAARAVWDLWRDQRRPAGCPPAGRLWHTGRGPSAVDLKLITGALQSRAKVHREAGDEWGAALEAAEADLGEVVAAYHTGRGFDHWQGENDRKTTYLGLTVMLGPKKLDAAIERAEAWSAAGRPPRDSLAPARAAPRGRQRGFAGMAEDLQRAASENVIDAEFTREPPCQ